MSSSFFLLINTWYCFLAGSRGSICISKSQRILWVSFSWIDLGLCIYDSSAWPKFNLQYNSLWIAFFAHCCQFLYSFCARLLSLSFYSFKSFSYQCKLMIFQWNLSDTRTLLSIPADLNSAVIWMVSTCLLISKFSSPCNNPMVTVLSSPITIGITITFMLHIFFYSQVRSRYLSLFLLSINSTLLFLDGKVHNSASSLFFVDCL